jgi:hypothetical protein
MSCTILKEKITNSVEEYSVEINGRYFLLSKSNNEWAYGPLVEINGNVADGKLISGLDRKMTLQEVAQYVYDNECVLPDNVLLNADI